MKSAQNSDFKRGMTMLEVAFAILILSIVMTAFSAVLIQNVRMQLRIFHSIAAMEIERKLDAWISQKLTSFFEQPSLANCQSIQNDMNDYFVENLELPKGYDVWVWNNPASSSPHTRLDIQNSSDVARRSAVSRCSTLQTPTLTPDADAISELYFCLRFLADRELTGSGYFQFPSFVEVKFAFVDFANNSPLTCGQYTSKVAPLPPPQRGAVIYYKLYTECDSKFVRNGCVGGSNIESNYGRNIFSGVIYALH